MSEAPAPWWRGQAAGIPSKQTVEGFPLWPSTTSVTVTIVEDDLDATVHDAAAYEAGQTSVLEHLQVATARLEEQAARLETATEVWPPDAMRVMRQPRDATKSSPQPNRKPRRVKKLRSPAVGLASMLALALLTVFFAWTSAEPFWLDMGHGTAGTAKVTSCKGSGVLRRCYAQFGAEVGVPLVGLEESPGTTVNARMVPGGRIAYAGDPAGLRVRWAVGLGLVLLCGVTLCWTTGAGRLSRRLRTRFAAYCLTVSAPLTLALAVVLIAY